MCIAQTRTRLHLAAIDSCPEHPGTTNSKSHSRYNQSPMPAYQLPNHPLQQRLPLQIEAQEARRCLIVFFLSCSFSRAQLGSSNHVLRHHAIENFNFHSLGGFRSSENFPDDIRSWRKVLFKGGLTSPLHVDEDRLPEVPQKEIVHWSLWVVPKSLVHLSSSNAAGATTERYDLVIVLNK